MRLTTSSRRRGPARTTALALIGLVVGMLPFVVPGVLAPKVAHAAPSMQTSFPIFGDVASGVYDGGNGGPATTIVSGPGGDLWMNQARASVIKLTPSGSATECVTSGFDGTSWGYSYGYGLTVGSDGNLWATMQQTYVTSSSSSLTSGVIARVTPTCVVTYYPTTTSGSFPYKITAGPSGYLWFTENAANNIGVISTSGAMREFAIPTASSAPTGIVSGPDGNLWFTENSADKLGRMTPTGTFTEFPVTVGAHPYDIAVGPDNNLWFTENGGNAIGTMTTSGTGYAEYPAPTSAAAPSNITRGPDGAMWFGEQGSTTAVARITMAGSITEYPTSQGYPFGITTGPDGNIWWTGNAVFHSGGSLSPGVFRLPLVPCGDLTSSVTSANNDTGVRDIPGSQQQLQISLSNCGVPTLTGAVTSTAVTPPSGCPSAPAIPSFTSPLTYGQSTSQTFTFSDPSCLGTYTVTTTTTSGSTAVASATTYYVVSNGHGSHIVGDFNGDGYQDVALADIEHGTVAVYYGGPNGLETRAPQVFSEATPGMPSQVAGCPAGTPNSGDLFGEALAAGRFEGGGYSDLAIGIPGCGATANSANGGVLVLKGGPAGLSTMGSYFFYAPSSMSSGFAEFGRSIVTGDFNHDGYSDVVIAAPLQNVGSIAEEGAVDIMYGSPTGLTGQNVLTENSPGVPGPAATRYDNFGWNMAAGDFNGDGNSDVAINEGENKNGVVVLYGSASGLILTGAQYLQEIAGSEYSAFLATGKFKGGAYDDLAIGEPYGGTGGLVEVHYGSASGLGTVAYGTSQKITLKSSGMPVEPSGGGYFGVGLAAGDIKHNGHADLIALGAPGGAIVMWGTSTKLATRGSRFVPGNGGVSITGNIGLGDFNGDGYADELFCFPFADIVITNPTCNVYKGTATGLSTNPSQTFNQYVFQMSSLQGNHAGW